ncbi:MAG: UTRA domain-containing protein, partial [Spirochaetia bacterium]|nr:UTRA domain-containing protein [Spirochaetia bacterium]
ESVIKSQEKIVPPAEISAALGIAAGDFAVKIERIRIADKIPFLYEIQYYSFTKFSGLLDLHIKGSMYQVLIDKFGIDLDHSIRTLQAVRPSKEIASRLMISRDIPCIFYKSRAFNATGDCIEVLHSYYRGDRYIFQVETGSYVRT